MSEQKPNANRLSRDAVAGEGFYSAETAPSLPAQRVSAARAEATRIRQRTEPRALRFAQMPFLALLPQISEVGVLRQYPERIRARLKAIHSHVSEGGTEESLKALAAEETMLNQVIQWLGTNDDDRVGNETSLDYDEAELFALYELGRLYLEMGYFGPSERIFAGLSALGSNATPARIGLGVLRLERGLYDEAVNYFRGVTREGAYVIESKLGLCFGFLARGETQRAASLLSELKKDVQGGLAESDQLRILWQVLARRCTADDAAL